MNFKKSSYFKTLCLLGAAFFTTQCASIERKLVSTEEKVIENESRDFVYEYEKIKTPSAQDPTLEYRIVKFPANKIEKIGTYKFIKVDRSPGIITGVIAGAVAGILMGNSQIRDTCVDRGKPILGFLLGAPLGGFILGQALGPTNKTALKEEIKKSTGNYLQKKADSTPIPVENLPLEFKCQSRGKIIAFKTQTNEQGIVRVNLVTDLKIKKFRPGNNLMLYIYYFNQESQLGCMISRFPGPGK
ncbi:MAG TPA: hypothetical protein VK186_27630 [Candidatus Deferrimicrobium sp.]|nr:hypothetical protein [Candidatus Deferrimicrobium sp.]